MKTIGLITLVVMFVSLGLNAHAVILTFDDIPDGTDLDYYALEYGINIDSVFSVAEHSASTWGSPHSGNKVMVCQGGQHSAYGMMFKDDTGPLYASSVSGYFSTEAGVELEMIAYNFSLDQMGASVLIGASDEFWNNKPVTISSSEGIGIVEFRAVTTDALEHFCVDDLSVNFVPEPASILGLLTGLAGIGGIAWRKR